MRTALVGVEGIKKTMTVIANAVGYMSPLSMLRRVRLSQVTICGPSQNGRQIHVFLARASPEIVGGSARYPPDTSG
jgi:hypothetical protein